MPKYITFLALIFTFSHSSMAALNIVADSVELPLNGSTVNVSYSHNTPVKPAQCFLAGDRDPYHSHYPLSPNSSVYSIQTTGWGYHLATTSDCNYSPALNNAIELSPSLGNAGLVLDYDDQSGMHTHYPVVAWSSTGLAGSNAYIGGAAHVSSSGLQQGGNNCNLGTALTCSYQMQDEAGHYFIVDLTWPHPMGDGERSGVDATGGLQTASPKDGTTLSWVGEGSSAFGGPANGSNDFPVITAHALSTHALPMAQSSNVLTRGAQAMTIAYTSTDEFGKSYGYTITLDLSRISITQPTCVAVAPNIISASSESTGTFTVAGTFGWQCDAAPEADAHSGQDVTAGSSGISRLWIAPANKKYDYSDGDNGARAWPLSDDGNITVSLTTSETNKDLTAPDASTIPGAVTAIAGETNGSVQLNATFNVKKGAKPGHYSREFIAIFSVD